MNSKLVLSIAGGLVVLGAGLGWLAWRRVGDARSFAQSLPARTYAGTNYVFQYVGTTVGRSETGCVLIINARIQNPNPHELILQRDWFVLADGDRNYYQPISTGTQTGRLRVPAQGVLENESFHFVLPVESLAGMLALMVGHQQFATLKSARPLSRELAVGQYTTFRRRDW